MKAGGLHPIERFPMRRERLPFPGEQIVSKHVQLARRYFARIELANRAGGRVARIRKARLAFFFALGVDLLKDTAGNEGFAAHFEFPARTLFVAWIFSGILRIVRTFCVTSSPVRPSPRVSPRTRS